MVKYEFINLYFEDEELEETEKNKIYNKIKTKVKKLTQQINKIDLGIKINGVSIYKPKYYNFETDSIDLDITITNKEKLINNLNKINGKINNALLENKSYDGYIPLTADNYKDVINNIINNNKLDYLAFIILITENNNQLKQLKKDVEHGDYEYF